MKTLLCIAAMALLTQTPAGPPPSIARPSDESAEHIEVSAVRAANEGRGERVIDAEIKALEKIFEKLPYDTFSLEAERAFDAPHGGPTTIPLNDAYALEVTPHERQESGEVELDARIMSLTGDNPVAALITKAKAAPGKALIFRGLPLDGGELIVIMRLAQQDGDQGGQSSSSDEQEQSEAQEQEQQAQEQDAKQEQEEEQQQQDGEQETPPDAGEAETKSMADEEAPADKESQDLEALLQSLEEQDGRERRELLNRQDWMEMRKDWW